MAFLTSHMCNATIDRDQHPSQLSIWADPTIIREVRFYFPLCYFTLRNELGPPISFHSHKHRWSKWPVLLFTIWNCCFILASLGYKIILSRRSSWVPISTIGCIHSLNYFANQKKWLGSDMFTVWNGLTPLICYLINLSLWSWLPFNASSAPNDFS